MNAQRWNFLVPVLFVTLLAVGVAPPAHAQSDEDGSFDRASTETEADLAAALAELTALRERIAAEKLPMTRELNRLET